MKRFTKINLRRETSGVIKSELVPEYGLCVTNTHWLFRATPLLLTSVSLAPQISARLEAGQEFTKSKGKPAEIATAKPTMIQDLLNAERATIERTDRQLLGKTGVSWSGDCDKPYNMFVTPDNRRVWVNGTYAELVLTFRGSISPDSRLIVLTHGEEFMGFLCTCEKMEKIEAEIAAWFQPKQTQELQAIA